MTLSEYKADLERETGAKLSMAAAKALFSQYKEHEAEAIAGGRDDFYVPAPVEVRESFRYDAHDPALDSTGHVYMMSPEQQEGEIDYMGLVDYDRERFGGDEHLWDDSPSDEELEAGAELIAQHSTPGAFSPWFPSDECPF